jgi:hypothetical protein
MVDVDVVYDKMSTRIQDGPHSIQLKSDVAFRVATVVDEEVGTSKLPK